MHKIRTISWLLLVIGQMVFASSLNAQTIVSNFNYSNAYFAGRSEVLAKLKVRLGESHLLQINGISGVGKTALVSAFAELNKSHYDIIWWINSRAELLSQCTQFLKLVEKRLGTKIPASVMQASADGVFDYVKQRFKDEKILLIVDDVKVMKGAMLRLVHSERGNNLDIIITSQQKIPDLPALALGSLSKEGAQELITRFFPEAKSHNVSELAQKLHYFPIALVQALQYMKFHSYDIVTYLRSLENDAAALRDDESRFIHKHKDHLAQWDHKHKAADVVIVKYLQDIVSSDPQLEKVLYVLPFLSQQFVSRQFLNGYLEFTYGAKGSCQALYGKMLATGLLMNAMTGEGFFYHEIIKYITPSDDKVRQSAVQMGRYLLSLMEGREVDNFQADETGSREYIDHVRAYLDMCEKMDIVTQDVLKLRVLMTYYLDAVTREMDSCLQQLKLIDKSDDTTSLPGYYKVLHTAMACKIYFKTHDHDQKNPDKLYNAFLAQWDSHKNNAKLKNMKLRVFSVIISHLLTRQQPSAAQSFVEEGDALMDEISEPFQKLVFIKNRCWYLCDENKPAEAIKSVNAIWPLLDEGSFGALKCQFALEKAINLNKLNDLKEAEKFAYIAEEEANSYFGSRCVDIKAEVLGLLGEILLKQGDYAKAMDALEKTIDAYRRVYKQDGQVAWQVGAKLHLAQCLLGLGKANESLEKGYEVELEFDRIAGESVKNQMAKNIYTHIIKAAWLAKQPGVSGRYLAKYESRFGKALPSSILSKLHTKD